MHATRYTEKDFQEVYGIIGTDEEGIRLRMGTEKPPVVLLEILDRATTFEECKNLSYKLKMGSEIERKMLEKALELATSVEECLFVHRGAFCWSSRLRKQALDRALELAESNEERSDIFKSNASEFDSIEDEALKAILDDADIEKCLDIHKDQYISVEIRAEALDKAFKQANTIEKCFDIYDYENVGDEIMDKALDMALDLAENTDECLELYDKVSKKQHQVQVLEKALELKMTEPKEKPEEPTEPQGYE